ncbi:TRAP transporter small permease protein [Anaerobacillus arseniciselenatis]|uniref:TRAP transporter small permease protein n=1 Tax=Anaerobacillus arseniciselenatis TaxID=85682 RepID=A0A1S2LGP8_9BACI|nr:TRAP transporter small permease [Anaerobacillus arseniciselenatis]OIJ11551.1 TRAP transporter small permease protein [Anaerobacillus arseniciselenatis]
MKIVNWLDEHFEEVFLVVLSTIMVVVIFSQVFMRYVMQSSLSWSEELARYCFIWLVYIGISYGVKKQRHIKVDAFLLLFKEKGKLVFNIIANLLFLAFAIYVVIYGYTITERFLELGQKSPANQIPMGLIYLAAPFGMAITSIRLIQNLIKQIKTLFGKDDFTVKTELERLRED